MFKNLNGFQKFMFFLVLIIVVMLGVNIKKTNQLIELNKNKDEINTQELYELIKIHVQSNCVISNHEYNYQESEFVKKYKEIQKSHPTKNNDEILAIMGE